MEILMNLFEILRGFIKSKDIPGNDIPVIGRGYAHYLFKAGAEVLGIHIA